MLWKLVIRYVWLCWGGSEVEIQIQGYASQLLGISVGYGMILKRRPVTILEARHLPSSAHCNCIIFYVVCLKIFMQKCVFTILICQHYGGYKD